jgi:hypothetical protein
VCAFSFSQLRCYGILGNGRLPTCDHVVMHALHRGRPLEKQRVATLQRAAMVRCGCESNVFLDKKNRDGFDKDYLGAASKKKI